MFWRWLAAVIVVSGATSPAIGYAQSWGIEIAITLF